MVLPRKQLYRHASMVAIDRVLSAHPAVSLATINARLHEAAAPLAWIYARTKKQHHYAAALKHIGAWLSMQHRDGSFSQYTRAERSYAATAFSSRAITAALLQLGLKRMMPASLIGRVRSAVRAAGRWLLRNDETIYWNQEAAAALALHESAALLQDGQLEQGGKDKMRRVLSAQHATGHYPERKGFDLGYSSLTLALLALYHRTSHDARIKQDIIRSAQRFLALPLSRLFSRRNVRGTDWVISFGFEYFSGLVKDKGPALRHLGHVLGHYDFIHLPDVRHCCTDTIYLCEAHDAARAVLPHERTLLNDNACIRYAPGEGRPAPEAGLSHAVRTLLLSPVRVIGMHRIRKLYRWLY